MLWWMVVEAPPPATLARWLATLDEKELARADRFRFAIDRETYIAAHALTRALLSHVEGHPPSAWRFVAGPAGKPRIDPAFGPLRTRFSLSHTRGLVACAAALDAEIGLDVEADDRDMDELDLARQLFAPEEVLLLQDLEAQQRRRAFFRLWTLKEAYIKATGQGLACPLDAFSFGLEPIAVRFRPDIAGDPASWQFFQLQATERHVIAVALRRRPAPGDAELRVVRRMNSHDDF
jgi:4'-phosphopantetheinyl transferase